MLFSHWPARSLKDQMMARKTSVAQHCWAHLYSFRHAMQAQQRRMQAGGTCDLPCGPSFRGFLPSGFMFLFLRCTEDLKGRKSETRPKPMVGREYQLLANTWYNVDKQNGLQSRGKMA